MNVIAITACPTGIAHTYMAADNLHDSAKQLGISIKVETQGALGIEHQLTEQDVLRADIVVFATDIEFEQKQRFDNLPSLQVSTKNALQNPKWIFTQCKQILTKKVRK